MVSFVVHVAPANKGSNRKGRKSVGGQGASQEERNPSDGQWSSVHCLELANDVKCLPSKMFCPTRNIVGVPREPRGAGEFRLTGHSGFSAVRAQLCAVPRLDIRVLQSPHLLASTRQNSDCGSTGSVSSGPSFFTD